MPTAACSSFGRGPRRRADADAVEFAGRYHADVGAADEGAHAIFRVIRYDRRGHGKSGVPPGPYSMERFGRDVLAILDDLNIEKAHWCGLSMGGMVGQWLGANAPERFEKHRARQHLLLLCRPDQLATASRRSRKAASPRSPMP